MPCSLPRTLLPWFTCTLLTTACLPPKPAGECSGIHLGQSVRWPITLNSAQSAYAHLDGTFNTQVGLNYTTSGVQGLQGFGVGILLMGEPYFEAVGSRTAKLMPQQDRLAPEETSLVREWEANKGPGEYGYLSPPGVPVEATVTLERVTPDHAEGHFVYRYADGGELTCTFDVPDRIYDDGLDDGGGGGGGGDYDD